MIPRVRVRSFADGMKDNFADGRVYEAIIGDGGGPPTNLPPTTTGIANESIFVGDPEPVIDLFAAFDDFEDPDEDLTYTIANNSNSSLVTATTIDGSLGTLSLTCAPDATGSAEITVRATDTGNPALSVDTTFTLTVDVFDPNAPVTIQSRVAASSDDAEERPSGSVLLTSSDLELTLDGSNQQVVGMRFTGLNIPPVGCPFGQRHPSVSGG